MASVLKESLALRATRMYEEGSTYRDIGKALEVRKSRVPKLIREGLSMIRAQSAAPEIEDEPSHQVPDDPKRGGKKRRGSRKTVYELDGRLLPSNTDFLNMAKFMAELSPEESARVRNAYSFLKLAEKGGGSRMNMLPMLLNYAKSTSGALGVDYNFSVLRHLCRYQKWGRCWETRGRCEPDYCPYF